MSNTQAISTGAFNPFRRPDWRFERVLQMVDGNKLGRSTWRDDDYVKGLRKFIVTYRNGDAAARRHLEYSEPGLFYAYLMHDRMDEDNNHTAEVVEARLLARQPDGLIAADTPTLPDAIEWYEALFFNVRDRLAAPDWIVTQVLLPAFLKKRNQSQDQVTDHPPAVSEPFFDGTLKFFAYFGGPYVLDYVIAGFRRGLFARNHEEVGMWFDQQYANRLKHRSAMAMQTFEVNRWNVMLLFEKHNQLMQIERMAESREQAQDQLHKSMSTLMGEMPWAVGDDGAANVQGIPVVARYDKGASELRDGEVLQLAAGQPESSIVGGVKMLDRLPPPKQKTGQEDLQHAQHAQQGS